MRTAFNWRAYPSWSMIATWNKSLRQTGVNFDLTHASRMWHLVENESGSGSWETVQRMSLSRYTNDPVRAAWTTNATRWLIQAIVGYQHAFGPMAPQPMEVPPPAPEGATPAQITAAKNAREVVRLHNVTVDNDRITAATAIGTTIGEIA